MQRLGGFPKRALSVPRLVPPGGNSAQLLKKSSAADYDVAWQNESEGSGESDLQRRNQLLETTISADVRCAPITLIDRWADGYGDASGIVSGSSSNYSVDTTNKRVNLSSAFASEYKLVIHGDGADASTTFTDAATSKTITANGNVQVDTAQSVFGGASVLFDGTGDYLSLADHADWDFGSGDFTVDFRVRFASVASNRNLFMQGSAWNSNFSWGVQWVQAGNLLYFYYTTDGSTSQSKTFSWTPSANTWYHVAIVRNGNNLMAFVNGTQIGSTQSLSGVTIYNSSANLVIGAGISGLSGDHDGWLDEIAIRKGTAAWTANFTPPAAAYAGTPSNMTLVIGASLSAEAAPATMRVLLDLEPIDSITLNTDYTVEVSRDGGTTWTAGTLSQIRTIGTRYIVETNAVSVSGQPSGTNPRARLKTFNNKDVRTLGVALQWS